VIFRFTSHFRPSFIEPLKPNPTPATVKVLTVVDPSVVVMVHAQEAGVAIYTVIAL
jgi:hypothetical protein